jgi:putative toxin-antitoxin system antitoxin component (TIGR02293 family)
MVPTTEIARILGLGKRVASANDLRRVVGRGLPKRALGRVVDYVAEDSEEAVRLRNHVVPLATYKRRTTTLKPDESEKLERIARVIVLAEAAFGSREQAREFLHARHPELGGDRPLDAARTELGARLVEEVLWRMEHGLPA